VKNIYFCCCSENGGIYHYILKNGELCFSEKTSADKPMYMVIDDDNAHIILKETDAATHFGGAQRFKIDAFGRLTNASQITSTNGIVPCHLTVLDNEVYVVNYLSGNIVKLPDKIDKHSGIGVHPTRQTAPHTHFVTKTPDNKHLLCVDLGIDTIFCYDTSLNVVSTATVPEGYGARHLVFSEDKTLLYCVNELVSSVSVFKVSGNQFIYLDTYKALPDYEGKNTAAAIRIKGEYLYISNRGANTISKFKICGEALELVGNFDCFGDGPRDFDIIEDLFFCTNEQSDDVTVLKETENGFELVERLEMPSPICVVAK